MKWKNAALIFGLTSWVLFAYGQYTNTDELLFIPGLQQPISLHDFNERQEIKEEVSAHYLSQFLLPGNGGHIISRFGPRSGRMHYGTDIKMNEGDTVLAANSGFVARANWGYGFGNLIIIRHENNIETYYAHLSEFLVEPGTFVNKGEAIALAGSTGRARGPHLHFEMRENNTPFDAEMVFDFENNTIREEAKFANALSQLHKTLKPKGYANNLAVPEFYKVKPGDSLWVISRRFKTPIPTLCQLNKITENSILQIGQPLKMY